MKKLLLLGSGELGKEFVIACQRLGHYIVAVDSYDHAPAMQVAHEKEIINMLDGYALDALVEKHQPDFSFIFFRKSLFILFRKRFLYPLCILNYFLHIKVTRLLSELSKIALFVDEKLGQQRPTTRPNLFSSRA